jgi:hypothetical protein
VAAQVLKTEDTKKQTLTLVYFYFAQNGAVGATRNKDRRLETFALVF